MKDRPLIVTTELIPKILDGTKTQTRRVIKPQPHPNLDKTSYYLRDYRIDTKEVLQYCPYGQVGDRLWCKETWSVSDGTLSQHYIYKADGQPHPDVVDSAGHRSKGRWRSPLFMPRRASRMTLEITGIRVERLQEITEEDVLAEGITVMRGTWQSKKWNEETRRLELTGEQHPYTGRYHFEVIWDSLNAKRGYSWESNPWVWVIEFKKVDCSE